MSIKLSIKYPNGGPVHTVEAPLSRNASTRPGVTGEAVHQMMMIHDYTVNTINNVFDSQLERPQDQYRERGYYEEDRRNYGHLRYEHRARIVQYPPQGYEINRRHRDSRSRSPVRSDSHHRHAFDHVDWPTMQGIVRRVHDSCYVQRAVGHEHLTHPDDLMVGVGPVRKVTHKFIIKKFTPLRRVLNAYTGWEHKDPKFWELQWQGRRLGWGEGDTADKYGISHGDELTIVARRFVGDPKLLEEYGQAAQSDESSVEENDAKREDESDEEIKLESTGSSMDLDDDQVSP